VRIAGSGSAATGARLLGTLTQGLRCVLLVLHASTPAPPREHEPRDDVRRYRRSSHPILDTFSCAPTSVGLAAGLAVGGAGVLADGALGSTQAPMAPLEEVRSGPAGRSGTR
jgi:hypothetical protein